MSEIFLKDVSLTYPIYGSSSRSFKRDIISTLTGKRCEIKNTITSVNALKQISFSLKDGDYLGLIGHNGAGKSTLLKVLSGIYEVNQGIIQVNGTVASLLGGSTVGMHPELNAYENIKVNCIIRGCSKKETQSIIADVVEFTELNEFLALPVKTYSSGMQARLGYAISTAIHPDILILDEVVGTGDARFINKATERLHSLLCKANILVLASHGTDIIKKFCNKVLWLDHGEIKALGGVDDTLEQYYNSVNAT